MKPKLGNTYTAWLYDGDNRIEKNLTYAFKIVAESKKFVVDKSSVPYAFEDRPIFLGVKLGLDYEVACGEGSTAWFDESGISKCHSEIFFKIKRKGGGQSHWYEVSTRVEE